MKNRLLHLISIDLVFLTLTHALIESPEVTTKFGPVRGVWLTTARGLEIAGFLGLPYADPPILDLRFENPQPWTKKWTDVRNATVDGPMCLQLNDSNVIGDEDCLYLNIFTPTISRNKTEKHHKKLSVMVYVHGGSFNTGSSSSSLYAPTYLLDHEIILITMNYRLNVLGFFSTGNDVAPGNYGLKDIVAALVWIRDNVEAFGGDANSVTLAGHSSGAASIQILSASETTKGLFHKMITMSGSATAPWAIHSRENIRNSSMYVTKLVGCDENYFGFDDPGSGEGEIEETPRNGDMAKEIDKKIVACMKRVDAAEIIDHGYFYVWRRNPVCIFGPTLEAEAEGAVLTVHPVHSLSKGLFRDMPWIAGVTDDEGLIKTIDLFLQSEIKSEFIQNREKFLVPYVLELEHIIDNVTAATEAIEDFYFNGDVETNLDKNVTQLVGDALITWPVYDFLQKQSPKMKSNAYFYLFSYEGTFSSTFRWGIPFRFGVAHGDEINYIFPYLNTKFADLQFYNTMSDRTIINIMSEMWSNFVKTGIPSARLTSSWEPYQKTGRFMRFGNGQLSDRSMEEDFLTDRMAFWSKLMNDFALPIEMLDDGMSDSESSGCGTVIFYPVKLIMAIGFSLILICTRFLY